MVEFIDSDEPFVGTGDKIIVAVGIDGPEPPMRIQRDMREAISTVVNRGLDLEVGRGSVKLTIKENPSEEDRRELGGATLHVQQYDIDPGDREVDGELVNATHNSIVERLDELQFNVVGTKTTVFRGEL